MSAVTHPIFLTTSQKSQRVKTNQRQLERVRPSAREATLGSILLSLLFLPEFSVPAQDIAGTYRLSALSYRNAAAKAAPEQKGCLLQWADYYDCLARQLGPSPRQMPRTTVHSGGRWRIRDSSQTDPLRQRQRILDNASRIQQNNNNVQRSINDTFNALGNICRQGFEQKRQRDQEQEADAPSTLLTIPLLSEVSQDEAGPRIENATQNSHVHPQLLRKTA